MTRTSDKLLSFQTAALQALYWMTFCPIYAFASVFLLSKNFSNQQIGWVIALSNILAVFLQPALGTLIDRMRAVTVKMTLAILTIIDLVLLAGLILLPVNLLWLAILYVGVISLLITMQPLVTSLTFEYINAGRRVNFGITRAAGFRRLCHPLHHPGILGLPHLTHHPSDPHHFSKRHLLAGDPFISESGETSSFRN